MVALAGELIDFPAEEECRSEGAPPPGLPHPARSRRPLPRGEAASRWRWGTPGIRAQLVDIESKQLVHDFVLEGGGHSLHVLNAVSPAFTCALEFAKVVVDRISSVPTVSQHRNFDGKSQ